jgi:hypothetical protein
MHRVRLNNPRERRADRLASPSVADKRISYGCINAPVAFCEQFVRTVFARQHTNIYVLPDVRSVQEDFGLTRAATSPDGGSQSRAVDRPANILAAWQQVSR